MALQCRWSVGNFPLFLCKHLLYSSSTRWKLLAGEPTQIRYYFDYFLLVFFLHPPLVRLQLALDCSDILGAVSEVKCRHGFIFEGAKCQLDRNELEQSDFTRRRSGDGASAVRDFVDPRICEGQVFGEAELEVCDLIQCLAFAMDDHLSDSVNKWIFLFVHVVVLESPLVERLSTGSLSAVSEICVFGPDDHLANLVGKENSTVLF